MGEDKAGLMLAGKPLLRHVAERLAPQVTGLSVNTASGFPPFHFPLIPDSIAGQPGPLAGILAGLEAGQVAGSHLLTAPVDSPFLPVDLALRLGDALHGGEDIAVAASDGRDHPVFGLWPLALAQDLRDFVLNDEKRSIRGFLNRHRVRRVEFPLFATAAGPLDPFFNINRPEDLRRAETYLEHLTP